jgi:hypothetical protein
MRSGNNDATRCYGAGSGVRKEHVERNRTRCMGIQSVVFAKERPACQLEELGGTSRDFLNWQRFSTADLSGLFS